MARDRCRLYSALQHAMLEAPAEFGVIIDLGQPSYRRLCPDVLELIDRSVHESRVSAIQVTGTDSRPVTHLVRHLQGHRGSQWEFQNPDGDWARWGG